jgi:hypothetical protein
MADLDDRIPCGDRRLSVPRVGIAQLSRPGRLRLWTADGQARRATAHAAAQGSRCDRHHGPRAAQGVLDEIGDRDLSPADVTTVRRQLDTQTEAIQQCSSKSGLPQGVRDARRHWPEPEPRAGRRTVRTGGHSPEDRGGIPPRRNGRGPRPGAGAASRLVLSHGRRPAPFSWRWRPGPPCSAPAAEGARSGAGGRHRWPPVVHEETQRCSLPTPGRCRRDHWRHFPAPHSHSASSSSGSAILESRSPGSSRQAVLGGLLGWRAAAGIRRPPSAFALSLSSVRGGHGCLLCCSSAVSVTAPCPVYARRSTG